MSDLRREVESLLSFEGEGRRDGPGGVRIMESLAQEDTGQIPGLARAFRLRRRCPAGPIRDSEAARGGRHGRGIQRAGHPAGPYRGAESFDGSHAESRGNPKPL